MSIVRFIRDLLTRRMSEPLSEWFSVTFDAETVSLSACPPGRKPWTQSFRWADIERVCFKAEGPELSDGVYIYTRLRPESFVIPTEARGGSEFWAELIRRGHFDPELAISAASAVSGTFCWPPESGGSPRSP